MNKSNRSHIATDCMCEVAVPHFCSGNNPEEVGPLPGSLRLVVDKEESLVLNDRSAEGSAELIQVELFRFLREKAFGVKRGVAQKLKQRTMKPVSACFGREQHRRSRTRSVLCRVVVG